MAAHLGYTDHTAFARAHLLASPGATVLKDGVPYQIPTLVPQRREGYACHFLDGQNRCVIHACAPFGCRMFDSHQTHEEANRRSRQGLLAIARELHTRCYNV